jgi:hypothetical protein
MERILKIIASILLTVAVLAIWFAMRSRVRAGKTHSAPPKGIYLGLRNQMLQGSRAKFGLPAPQRPEEPWGVVMDWGVTSAIATVVALSDGTASVYLSSGGGYIGGQGQEPIRLAAQKAVEVARTVQLPPHPTADFPLPETGGVFFYFLTDAGVFTLHSSVQELGSPGNPLRKIGDAMQEIITQYRLWDQNGRKGGGGVLVPPDEPK